MTSTSYPAKENDWRGRFIADMACALAQKHLELSLWLPSTALPQNTSSAASRRDQEWLARMQADGGIIHVLRKNPIVGLVKAAILLKKMNVVLRKREFDVAHINWLQNALALAGCRKPALITVLGSDYGLLRLPCMVFLLRQVLKRKKSILAPNAEWMVARLQACFGDIAEIRPIPFGIHQRFFEITRYPSPVPRWLVVTRITRHKIGELFSWGDGCFGTHRELHLFGPMQEEVSLPQWIIWHGPTTPAELAKKWFPHASGLITLSQHDEGRPQVMIEAMAASLPIIASRIEAHENLIRHEETGYIIDSRAEFDDALQLLEIAANNHKIGNAARVYARNKIGTWEDRATQYVTAYNDLLNPQ